MCLQKYYCKILLCYLLQLLSVNIVYSLPPYDNRDSHRMKLDPMRMKFSDLIRHKHVLRTVSARDHTIVNETVTLSPRFKKWQVGRVSRKQYEIINMLWRKTKEFVDLDDHTSTANKYHPKRSFLITTLRFNPALATTPSFIEFYYLDDTADISINSIKGTTHKSPQAKDEGIQGLRSNNKMKNGFREHPTFTFHVDSNYVPLAIPIRHTRLNDNIKHNVAAFHPGIGHINGPIILSNQFSPQKYIPQEPVKNTLITYFTTKNMTFSSTFQDIETCPVTTQSENKETTAHIPSNISKNSFQPTIAYDRIKFFELYDKNTPLVYDEKVKYVDIDDVDHVINGNRINNVQKTLLEHVDHDIETQVGKKAKAKHSKKHIIEVRINDRKNISTLQKTAHTMPLSNDTGEKESNVTSIPLIKSYLSDSNTTTPRLNTISKIAEWSDFSFMAVYIFEPSQVHCDAAGISPHWLITSGSCLSRHHKNPGGEGRSAFVAYCGSFWWTADRVAYVKYSVVHPSFHQRDTKRRHMYNIGLIQVVISMDTCPGWAPISLMSHRYVTDPEGSVVHAVGWGLDRYSNRYSSADLPKLPLMIFESKVYSDACPGNYGYLQAMRLQEGGGVKNLYCMSLPPYSGEATDPIHGGMLIVGGKLCAIYLQEERRLLGEQSAFYTGTWRLGPWVTEVAREPEEAESFQIDI